MARKLTIEQLRTIAEGAALSLRSASERFEANKSRYQEGFTPSWLTSAESYYKITRGNYERAVVESADTDTAREEGSK